MIKFFRKFRQNSLSNGKTGAYLKYAFGEVVLVVIGILIALQINALNEKRNNQNTIKGVYSVIKSDLKSDIKNIDKVVKGYEAIDSVFRAVIAQKMTYEDYQKCERCLTLISGYPDLALKKRGLKLLEVNSILFETQNDDLLIEIDDFYSYFNKELEVSDRERSDDFTNNYEYFKNNMPWFTDYYMNREALKTNDRFITYLTTSSDYRNRVASFYLLHYTIHLNHLKDYQTKALQIIDAIDERIYE